MTPTRTLLTTLPLLALAACIDNPISRHFEWQRHQETVEFAPEPLYCYRTLAYSTCYAQPLDRREANRVVGYYGPSPTGRIVAAPPPALPSEKMGPATEYPPLMVPREKVDSEPLQLVPKQQSKVVIEGGGGE